MALRRTPLVRLIGQRLRNGRKNWEALSSPNLYRVTLTPLPKGYFSRDLRPAPLLTSPHLSSLRSVVASLVPFDVFCFAFSSRTTLLLRVFFFIVAFFPHRFVRQFHSTLVESYTCSVYSGKQVHASVHIMVYVPNSLPRVRVRIKTKFYKINRGKLFIYDILGVFSRVLETFYPFHRV